MRAESGMFYFLDRFDESRLTSRQNLPVSGLLMEAVRRMDDSLAKATGHHRADHPGARCATTRAAVRCAWSMHAGMPMPS